MQYPFTEEQLALADLMRDFMEREVAPVAAEIDARPDPKDCYPKDQVIKASKLGLRTIGLSEEYGGMNAGQITRTLALWTGTQVEGGVAKILSQCWKISSVIEKVGTKVQREKWLKRFVEEDDFVGSICMTEPDYGSDNVWLQPDPNLGIRSTAVRDGDTWVLNGAKRFNSLSGFSKIILFYARTDPKAPVREGTTCFLLSGEEEGITYGRTHDKQGYRLYPNGESYYDNVRVHKDDILGEVNNGATVFSNINRGSAELPACYFGLCRALFHICHEHAKERVQGGKVIIEHPTVRHILAEMLMNIEIGEQLMWRICWGVDHDESYNGRFTRYGKVLGAQVGVRMIHLACDVLGGNATEKDFPSEKIMRDITTFLHGNETDSVALLRVAETLDRPA